MSELIIPQRHREQNFVSSLCPSPAHHKGRMSLACGPRSHAASSTINLSVIFHQHPSVAVNLSHLGCTVPAQHTPVSATITWLCLHYLSLRTQRDAPCTQTLTQPSVLLSFSLLLLLMMLLIKKWYFKLLPKLLFNNYLSLYYPLNPFLFCLFSKHKDFF